MKSVPYCCTSQANALVTIGRPRRRQGQGPTPEDFCRVLQSRCFSPDSLQPRCHRPASDPLPLLLLRASLVEQPSYVYDLYSTLSPGVPGITSGHRESGLISAAKVVSLGEGPSPSTELTYYTQVPPPLPTFPLSPSSSRLDTSMCCDMVSSLRGWSSASQLPPRLPASWL